MSYLNRSSGICNWAVWAFCSLYLLSQFPERWASCHFLCAGFSSHSFSTVGAFAKLGFCCAWPPPCGSWAEVVSARLNPSYHTIYVQGVCNFLGSVLPQQRFEATDGPALQLRVTAQFYLASKGKYILKLIGWPTQKIQREGKPEVWFWLLLVSVFFSSPWACPM